MLLAEVKYSIRNLLRAPAFALTAILTLAVAIGASTTVFTVVDSVILKPLSYRDSGRLVVIWEKVKFLATRSSPYVGPNPRHEALWNERSRMFSDLCLLGLGTRGVSIGAGHPHLIGSVRALPNLLRVLKVHPLLGRDFAPGDAIKGYDKVAIVTYSIWQSMFHGQSNVIGRTIRLNDEPFEIIGVLPENFLFPQRNVLSPIPSSQSSTTFAPIGVFTPAVIDPNDFGWNSDYGNWIALGRLKTGVAAIQAEAEINTIQRQIVSQLPRSEQSSDALLAYVQPLQDAMVNRSRTRLWLLMAAVVSLMLIACVNLANTQLGRAIFREREAAMRSALGAGRWQLLWSGLSESLILSVLGGVAGILLAVNALDLLKYYGPVDLPRLSEVHIDLSVLLFSALTVISSALLFGLLPAVRFLRSDPQKILQQNSTRTQGSRHGRQWRLALIGLQVFGCTALLLVTGLFAKSLLAILNSDRGFESGHVAAAEVLLRSKSYDKGTARLNFDDGLLARLHALPGVTSAAIVSAMPLEGESWIDPLVRPDKPLDHPPLWNMRWVSQEYFAVVRERLIAGRFFEPQDRDSLNAIISESSAQAGWPDENPLGHQFKWRDTTLTVIGIVADARTNSLKQPPVNMAYLPYRSNPPYATTLLVRSSQNPEALLGEMRRAIWAQDAEVTISRVSTLDSQVDQSLASERFQTFVLIAFGTAAVLLAMLGIYGVLSYTIAGRTREIGVRMALGATRREIYSLTLSQAAVPVAIGLLCGLLASAASGRLIQRLLDNVSPTDWSVALAVLIILSLSAVAAAFFPARRAASIDPMQALRAD